MRSGRENSEASRTRGSTRGVRIMRTRRSTRRNTRRTRTHTTHAYTHKHTHTHTSTHKGRQGHTSTRASRHRHHEQADAEAQAGTGQAQGRQRQRQATTDPHTHTYTHYAHAQRLAPGNPQPTMNTARIMRRSIHAPCITSTRHAKGMGGGCPPTRTDLYIYLPIFCGVCFLGGVFSCGFVG